MTHDEFIELREQLRRERPWLVDCAQLNVYHSLASHFATIGPSTHDHASYRCHLAERFVEHLRLPAEWTARTHVSHGVRRSLQALFDVFARDSLRVAIPSDVYPVYLQLAREAGVAFTTFTRFPDDLDDASDAVLICEPAKPWGTTLEAAQVSRLIRWTKAAHRIVLVDSAYSTPPTSGAMQLVREGVAMLLCSLSKGWLIPNHGGVCITPGGQWFERTRSTFTALPKDEQRLRVAFAALTEHSKRPLEVASALSRCASRLDAMTTARPELKATCTHGYFAVSARTFDELLELGVLGIPAKVFGSTEPLSILSALDSP